MSEKGSDIIGVTLGWNMKPSLAFKGGKVLYGDVEKILYKEWYKKDPNWPHDPKTGEKLKIVD